LELGQGVNLHQYECYSDGNGFKAVDEKVSIFQWHVAEVVDEEVSIFEWHVTEATKRAANVRNFSRRKEDLPID
jgi:hypothetical protein